MKKKRKTVITILIVIALLFIADVVIVKIKCKKLEQELNDTNVFISFDPFLNEITWSHEFRFLHEVYTIHSHPEAKYIVGPLYSWIPRDFIELSPGESYIDVPEELWRYGVTTLSLYYPGIRGENSTPPLNTQVSISFDRPYTIKEIQQSHVLEKADWFWVDTYQVGAKPLGPCMPHIGRENSAYGMNCVFSDITKEAQRWVDTLNEYTDNSNTISGKEILKIKKGISRNEALTLEDINIIGCRMNTSDYENVKDNKMFRYVRNW